MLVDVVVEGSYRFVYFVERPFCFVAAVSQKWEKSHWFLGSSRHNEDSENGKQTVIFKMKKEKIKIMIGRRVTGDISCSNSSYHHQWFSHLILTWIKLYNAWERVRGVEHILFCFIQTIWEWPCLYRFLFFYILLNVPVVNVMNFYDYAKKKETCDIRGERETTERKGELWT